MRNKNIMSRDFKDIKRKITIELMDRTMLMMEIKKKMILMKKGMRRMKRKKLENDGEIYG